VELAQLRRENANLREQLKGGDGSADAAELRRLRAENEKLKEENSRLKRGLGDQPDNSRQSAGRYSHSSSSASQSTASAREKRRSSLEERTSKYMPSSSSSNTTRDSSTRTERMKSAAPEDPAPKPKKQAEAGADPEDPVAQGDRVQDLALPHPLKANTGTENYEKLKDAWLEGCEDEELPPPDDLEDHIDDLILAEKPKYVKEAVPLSCLIDSLAEQWMRDNVL